MKNAIKKMIALLTVCALIFCTAPLDGSSLFTIKAHAESGTCGDNLTWNYDESTFILTISGTGAMANYSYSRISSTDTTVTTAPWQSYYNVIKSVVINSGVTSIGDSAFYGCTALTSVIIGSGVTLIDNYSFFGCTELTDISIPNSVNSIYAYAFASSGLTSITIPDSVTTLGTLSPFKDCTNLVSISVSPNNSRYSSDSNGVLYNKNKTWLYQYPAGNPRTEFTIPTSVTRIDDRAFYNCTKLTNIFVPDNVKVIGASSFYGCTGLTGITIGNGITNIGSYAFKKCSSLSNIIIPDSVTSIGYAAFSCCTELTSIIVPDSVTSIGESAFNKCTNLVGITIGSNVSSIGKYAFNECTRLQSITIPDSVTSLGDRAFAGCYGLTNVTIGNGITGFGDYAFDNCAELTNVTLGSSVTSIGTSAFRKCIKLSGITIPDSVTGIGNEAFSGCAGLTSVIIPDSVTSIGYSAFKDCTGLSNVTIGNGVLGIGNGAFDGCTGLESITIPDSVTSLGQFVFINCTRLISVTIGNNVPTIGYQAFCYCSSLTNITIGNSVDTIQTYAFGECTNLTTVCYDGTQQSDISIGRSNTPLTNANWFYHKHNGQTPTEVNGSITATCTEEGYSGDVYFSPCGVLKQRGEVSPMLGHDYNAVVIDPTCTTGGYTTYTCTRCAKTYTDNTTNAFGHNWNENGIVTEPTCTKGGYTTYTCKYCSESYTAAEIEALGHAWNNGVITTAPVCGVEGVKTFACTRCGEVRTESVAALEHEYDVVVTEPTCTRGGYTTYSCNMCGQSYTTGETSALGHDWNNGVVTTPPTYTARGIRLFTCMRCGETYTEVIAALETLKNHVYGECGANGNTVLWDFNTENGELIISGNGAMQSYEYSSDTNTVDAPWYSYHSSIQTVTIEHGVTSIGDCAFSDCMDLTSVTIPNSVTSIGDEAFYFCMSLTSVIIPNSVINIGDEAFAYCEDMTNVSIPESVIHIGSWSFMNCTSLTEIRIPNSVMSIGGKAFTGCTSLTNVTIPNSVISIGSGAFSNCSGLTSVTLSDSITNIVNYAFSGCTGLTSITIPDSVTMIDFSAFDGCINLSVIEIPDSVMTIGGSAFNNTAYYNDVSNWKDNVLYIGNYLIQAKASLSGAYTIKKGTLCVADYAFEECKTMTSVIIPDSVINIGSGAFSGCSSLTNLIIPNSVTTIGYSAFSWCKGLTSLTISDNVTRIGVGAFGGCMGLTSITIPDSVTSIGVRAFSCCTGLTNVTIPDSVTMIELMAFRDCQSLNGVILPKDVTIESAAFDGCDNVKLYVYPNSYAEQYCIDNDIDYSNEFTVSFDSMGGQAWDATNQPINTVSVPIINPALPEFPTKVEKEKAIFLGWFTELYGNQRVYIGQSILGNQTFYARWAKVFEVAKTPYKLNYYVGDEVDTTGLVLNAECESGEIMRISDGYVISPEVLTDAGTQIISVTYGDATTSYLVNVYEPEQDGLSVHTMPNKTEYFEGETLDLSGLELAVHQNNNTETIITEGYDCVTATLLETPGEHRVVLAYNGMYTSFDVHVEAVVATNAEIVSPANITTFYTGDTLSTKGLALCVSYNNGTTQTVSTGFICSPQTLNQAGTQTIVVTYEGLTVYYDVSVIQKQLATLEVIQSPKQTVYYVGDTLNTKGLKMQRVYNNYDVKPITDLSAVSFAYDFSSSGQKTVTASYTENGKTVHTAFSVTVLQKPEIFSESVSAAAGDEFAVPICIRGNNGLAGFKVSVQYDASALVPLRVDAGSILGMNIEGNTNTFSDNAAENTSGKVDVIWAGARNMTDSGVLFTVYFSTDPSIGGNYPITVSYSEGDTFDAEFNLVKMVCTDATVTLDNSGYVPSPVIKAESINVQMSEQIRVPIHLKHSDGINSVMVLNVNYPADVFSFAALENGTASVLSATATANGVQIVLMNAPAATDSVLFTLVLNVSEKAGGRYTFEPVDPTRNIQTESGTVFIQTLPTTLVVEDQRIQQGTTTITVPVNIANNRGVMGLSAIISYDPNCLRLTDITRGESLTSGSLQKNLATEGQAILVYTDSSDMTANGTVFVLEFQVLAGLIDQTEISLSYLQEDTFNEAWDDVVLECSGASIYKTCPGDADEDGAVTLQDVVLITRWLAGGWNVTINETNSDVNRDGEINLKDVVLIRRYLAGGWGVVLR